MNNARDLRYPRMAAVRRVMLRRYWTWLPWITVGWVVLLPLFGFSLVMRSLAAIWPELRDELRESFTEFYDTTAEVFKTCRYSTWKDLRASVKRVEDPNP